jgi:hypothetical protein
MRRVAILTPAYDGKVVCDFTVSVAEVFRTKPADMEINLNFWMGEALLQKARSNLFCDAYEEGYSDVVFIDADQSFSTQAFFDLLSHPVHAVGIPVPMKVDEERYNIRPEAFEKHRWNAELSLLEVEVIGTGMLRLDRQAMDVLWNKGRRYHDGKERRLICDVQIVDGGMISEDVQICNKLRDSGVTVYADIKHTCAHFGTKRYTGDYRHAYATSLVSQIMKDKI